MGRKRGRDRQMGGSITLLALKQAKGQEQRQPLDTEKGKRQIVPQSLQRTHGPTDTWVAAHQNPCQTSALQSWTVCVGLSHCLWQIVRAAMETHMVNFTQY